MENDLKKAFSFQATKPGSQLDRTILSKITFYLKQLINI